jgi:hypothetical protein
MHGIIRVGHAVRALLADGDHPLHVTELAHGLYWAARWQPIPGTATRSQQAAPAAPADQSGGFRDRLPRLAGLAGWPAALAAPLIQGPPEQARAWLAGLADAAVIRYLEYGHGNPVMLVHSATAAVYSCQRSGLKAARISVANSSGSSQAAKWPPLPASWK